MKPPYRYVKGLSPAYRTIRRTVARLRYAGDAVWCPVCERGFACWSGGRSEGICPYCRAKCRHRMLALYLDAHLAGRHAPVDVLFFAPDWGMTRWLARRPNLRVRTTDLSAPGVDFHSDITAMHQLADGSVDLTLCCHVLEHVPADQQAMRELYRITRPGGTCVVQVPYARGRAHTDEDPGVTDPAVRIRRFGQLDHVRSYGRDVTARLSDAGFEVTPERWATTSPADAERCGLWDDTMFVCRKPAAAAAASSPPPPPRGRRRSHDWEPCGCAPQSGQRPELAQRS